MRGRLGAVLLSGIVALAACDNGPTDVPAPTVATVVVAPAGRTLMTGQTMKLTAYPKTADGTVLGSVRIDWMSEAESVATVEADGTVMAVGEGTAWISATAGGRSGGVQVTVVSAPLEVVNIEILNAPATLEIGQQVLLEAVLRAADGTVIGGRMVVWRSSHGPTASVTTDPNDAFALLSAHAPGPVVITAEAGGRTTTVAVVVTAPPVAVGSIQVSPGNAEIRVGGSRQWEASVRTSAGEAHPNPPSLVWSVDDPTVAQVDANGRVYSVGPGTTIVRATAGGVQGNAMVTVRPVFTTGQQRYLVEATVDPAGAPRVVELGTLTWYGESVEGIPAREILSGGWLTFETAGGITRYSQYITFDVVIDEAGGTRKVAFGSLSDSGTVFVLNNNHGGDEPVLRFISDDPQHVDFSARLDQANRLIVRQMLAAAPLLDYSWIPE